MSNKFSELRSRLAGGLLPAMATPYDVASKSVNLPIVSELVEFLLDRGVNGLFIGGTTGEGILLDSMERQRLHAATTEVVAGRVPVLLHVGANTTAESTVLAEHAVEIGADAVVAVTPFYYQVDDDSLLGYYQNIADAAKGLPLFVYDIPQMAVNGISPALLSRLSEKIPNFAGIKCSNANAQQIRSLLDAKEEQAIFLVGNERIALGSLALGADGMISGLATAIPEPFVALLAAFRQGDLLEAQTIQRKINRLIDKLPAGARIGAIKVLLQQRGIKVGPPIPPRPMPPESWKGWSEMQKLI